MASTKIKPKSNYPRAINELDEILDALNNNVVNNSYHVSELQSIVEPRLDEIYREEIEGSLFDNARILGQIPSIYQSLDYLDEEGFITYDKSFDNVCLTAKGKIKIENGGIKVVHDIESANNYVQLTAPERIRQTRCLAISSLILSIIAVIVSVFK